MNPNAGQAVFKALCEKFKPDGFRHDRYLPKGGAPDFPVQLHNGDIVSSLLRSETLNKIPVVQVDNVYAERTIHDKARSWFDNERKEIIRPTREEN